MPINIISKAKNIYKPPTYHAMRKNLLNNAWYNIQKLVEAKTKSPIHKYGCIICSNTPKNVVHQLVMNIMQICTADDVFFGSIHTTSNSKDINYIATKVK